MSWLTATRTEIKLTSPGGVVFTALWRGNERSGEKKLGIFSPPKFKGDIVQDLDSKSTIYPLTIYFNGITHNVDAEEFNTACGEVGQWEVIHPTKGPLILQLVSWREVIAPVEDANTTVFETQWIEPANRERIVSTAELASSILSQIQTVTSDTLALAGQLRANAYSSIQSFVNVMNKISGFTDSVMREYVASNALKQEQYNDAKQSLTNAIAAFGISNSDSEAIATATINIMLAIPGEATDFTKDLPLFIQLIDSIFTLTPIMTRETDFNIAIGQELGITASLMALCQSIVASEFASRADAVTAMENLTNIFNDTVRVLDETQNVFGYVDIDKQYYSQTQTYTEMFNLFTLTMEYLLSLFFQLKTEKRFTLKNARSPLEITVTEYGSLGIDDENYNLFLSSNQLSGNDILKLPAGREVVIYAS